VRSDSLAALVAIAFLSLAACRSPRTATAVDPDLANCVPPGAVAIANVKLDRIRNSPALASVLEALPAGTLLQASELLVSYDTKHFLVAARGDYRRDTPGAVVISPRVALFGDPSAISEARQQFRTGRTGAPLLLSRAGALPSDAAIRAVVQSGYPLPFTGNLANLNRLLRETEYSTVTARLSEEFECTIAAACRSPEDASRMEETFRGLLTLSRMSLKEQPDLLALYDAARLSRNGPTVNLTVTVPAQVAARLVGSALRDSVKNR